MISKNIDERPHCDEILGLKNNWALNLKEIVLSIEVSASYIMNLFQLKFKCQSFIHDFIFNRINDEFLLLSKFFPINILL
jgi:hypothetical protein